jgi:hypothetical protein
MTRDDIIRMAQKAGLTDPDLGECVTDYGDATEGVLRFAELVADAEREACSPYLKDGETPAERIERDHRDTLALMTLLAQEKTKNEALNAQRNELLEALKQMLASTAPRQWQGLTKKEFLAAVDGLEDLEDCWVAIEAKLKEKNNG